MDPFVAQAVGPAWNEHKDCRRRGMKIYAKEVIRQEVRAGEQLEEIQALEAAQQQFMMNTSQSGKGSQVKKEMKSLSTQPLREVWVKCSSSQDRSA